MQLDKYQASVLTFLFEKLPIGGDVDSLEFSLSGTFSGKYRVAHTAIEDSEQQARVVFTLPSYACSVFLALTRTKQNETARLLANLEDYERESSLQLGLGEVVITPDHASAPDAPFAVILLRTATSPDCADVPDSQIIAGQQTMFFLVVPLTAEEWELRRQQGHDALIAKFQADQKELYF